MVNRGGENRRGGVAEGKEPRKERGKERELQGEKEMMNGGGKRDITQGESR